MANTQTVKDVLEGAIAKEIAAQQLYEDLSKKMTNKTARETFQTLVRQEHGHQRLLERYLKGELKEGVLKIESRIDYKIAEHFEPTEINPEMELKDIYLRAANREKIAHETYLAIALAHPAGEVKTLLEELAAQELGHKHKLEYLFNEVAFPQTAGG